MRVLGRIEWGEGTRTNGFRGFETMTARSLATAGRMKLVGVLLSLTIELPYVQQAVLAAKAQLFGLSPEEYARLILEHDLAPEWLSKSWKSSKEQGLDQLSV